ncbi:hypothetical protein [Bradyrhizobium sp. AUGA SZCCT0222]|uniref:hypothetical protein n=1 Tax=Bradyrhizobium sp. AUGA SZCCT0222 TaxID=2807668 RepID=UPI0032DF7FBF
MLAHSQEAADADNDSTNLAVFVQDDFVDITQLFIGFIVDVEAHELRRAPVSLEHHLGVGSRRAGGRGRGSAISRLSGLGISRGANYGNTQKSGSDESLHFILQCLNSSWRTEQKIKCSSGPEEADSPPHTTWRGGRRAAACSLDQEQVAIGQVRPCDRQGFLCPAFFDLRRLIQNQWPRNDWYSHSFAFVINRWDGSTQRAAFD